MKAHDNSQRTRLEQLLGPPGPDIGCDACFDLIDEYVDLELAGVNAEERVSGLRAHLAGCPACREEYESLRALAAGQGHS
jgi:anti-sigma factor RsiW